MDRPNGAKLRQMRRQVIEEEPMKDFEYLIHHILVSAEGKEDLHHCFVYDHICNMFEQAHLVIKNGKASIDGRGAQDGTYHIIYRLEPSQEVSWSDEEAQKEGITPKRIMAGMTLKQKAREW